MPYVAFRGANESRRPGWGGRKSGGIYSVNNDLCKVRVVYFFIPCYFVIAFTLLQGNLGTPLSTSLANSLYEPQTQLSADEYIEIIDMQSSQ